MSIVSTHIRMATIVQKNAIKSLSNGNSKTTTKTVLVHHHQMQQHLNGFNTTNNTMIPQTHQFENHQLLNNGKSQSTTTTTTEEQTNTEQDSLLLLEDEKNNEELSSECIIQEPELDIMISNVVCSFSVRCHLNLREIALNGVNVEYRKENGMITMKLRRPYTTASIWSSGKITCTGATSEDEARQAARKFARSLQKLGFNVKFNNYRVVNVLGTCSMPFAIRINSFSQQHREADYEPELHPGVTYKIKIPKATLKIFSTGSITVTAPSVADVQAAIEHIYPLVYEFRKERSKEELEALAKKKLKREAYDEVLEPVLEEPEEDMEQGDENWVD